MYPDHGTPPDSHRTIFTTIKRWSWNPRLVVCSLVAVVYLVYLLDEYSPASTSLLHHAAKAHSAKGGKPKFVARTEAEGELLAEFSRRRKRVKEVCQQFGAFTTKEKVLASKKLNSTSGQLHATSGQLHPGVEDDIKTWTLLKKSSHHQFFLQKNKELLWCKVPKAASTSWLYAFLKLANVPEYQIPEDNGMGLHALLREKYPLLAKNLYKKYIPLSLKFMIVRHPFERLMSAYLDKLDNYSRDLKYRGGYYHAMYGGDIVSRYRELYINRFHKNQIFLRKEPSFVEFVHYLIESPVESFDEHWKPMYLLCPPCHFNFDIIVKMETFNRDSSYILESKNINISLQKKHSIKQKGKVKKSSEEMIQQLFSQLSKRMVRALYDKYRVDFLMFDYTIADYIRVATDSVGFLPDRIEQDSAPAALEEQDAASTP